MVIAAGILAVLCMLVAVGWPFHRPPAIAAAYAAALALFLLGPAPEHLPAFTWIKIASLLPLALALGAFPALGERGRRRAARLIVALIGLNILEATIWDAAFGSWANAAVGAVLLATTPRPADIRAEAGRTRVDVAWSWIAAYSFWNIGFVIAAYPQATANYVAVLLAPVVVALLRRDPADWAAARVWTLAAYAVGITVWRRAWGLPWFPDVVPDPMLHVAAGALAVAACLWHLALLARRREGATATAAAGAR